MTAKGRRISEGRKRAAQKRRRSEAARKSWQARKTVNIDIETVHEPIVLTDEQRQALDEAAEKIKLGQYNIGIDTSSKKFIGLGNASLQAQLDNNLSLVEDRVADARAYALVALEKCDAALESLAVFRRVVLGR